MSLSKVETEPKNFSPERERPKIRVVLDVDEVLVDSMRDWLKALNEVFGTKVTEEELIKYGHTTLVPQWQALGEEFDIFSEDLRSNPEFVRHHPEVPGAREGVKRLISLGFEIKAYLTSRPEGVRKATEEALSSLGFPQAPIICRPRDLPYDGVTRWKAETLAALAQEGETLVVIDDNPFLPPVLAEIAPEVKVVILRMPHNKNKIKDGYLNAPWEEIPDLIKSLT